MRTIAVTETMTTTAVSAEAAAAGAARSSSLTSRALMGPLVSLLAASDSTSEAAAFAAFMYRSSSGKASRDQEKEGEEIEYSFLT